jgi:hypothetical protein
VELVENDYTSRFEERIVVQQTNENPRRDNDNARLSAALAIEPHMIADFLAEPSAALARHAPSGRTRGEPARLQHENASTRG